LGEGADRWSMAGAYSAFAVRPSHTRSIAVIAPNTMG
jgi:hypothetical protein